MLKPTVKKDCCWHNVSQFSALGHDVRQSPRQADSSSAVTGPHTECDPSLIGFGEPYYDRLSQLIDKHLELGTDDCVCYVGDDGGAHVVPILTQQYCLVKPVIRVNPHFTSSDGSSLQMDEVFSFQPTGLKSELYFDKIVIYNSIHLFSDIITELLRFVNALTERGRLLIIHRPIRLNTLPLPAHIVNQLRSADLSLEQLISTIQSLGLEFRWEVEHSTVVMSRHKWLNMIQCGEFPLCKQFQETQPATSPDKTLSTTQGVHELMTGVLRYAGDSDIEFVDRMVFLTVSRASPIPATKNPTRVSVRQYGKSKINSLAPLEMEVTPEIRDLLHAKKTASGEEIELF